MDTSAVIEVLTVGHSTHSAEAFLALLTRAEVTAVADVRTSPFSRHIPQFNRETLRDSLRSKGIAYVYLGKELGGRPTQPECYSNGVADYEKMASTETFAAGLERVLTGAAKYRIALMCAEQDPIECHRCLLVGRALVGKGVGVRHILSSGKVVGHEQVEGRLLDISGRNGDDFFASRDERLSIAYREHSRKVAYAEPLPDGSRPMAAE